MKKGNLTARAAMTVIARLPRQLKRSTLFALQHGYWLPREPQTFSEKIQWRIINDRRDIIAVGGDKLRMKDYARSHCPGLQIPETLWSGTDIAEMLDVDWGCDWVLKPITGSGAVAFGTGSVRSSGISMDEIERWTHDEPRRRGEWAYELAQPGYLIERRIETPDGALPADIKVFVFHGSVKFIYYSTPRSEQESHRFYSPDWQELQFRRPDVELAPIVEAPENLEKIIEVSETLGREFDFIRVDLFSVVGELHFGELTPYPAGGLRKFSPVSADRAIGDLWDLPKL